MWGPWGRLSDVGEVGAARIVLLPAVWMAESVGVRGHHLPEQKSKLKAAVSRSDYNL